MTKEEKKGLFIQAWKSVFGVDSVNDDDNFFEVGGDSIKGVQLVGWLIQKGLKLDMLKIYTAPTVAELAEALEETQPMAVPEELLTKENVDRFMKDPVVQQAMAGMGGMPQMGNAQQAQMCTPQGQPAQMCTPQGQPAQMCTPQGQPIMLCTPPMGYAQPMQLCTPYVQPAQMCTPQGQPAQLCTPQVQPAQMCTPYAQPMQLCTPYAQPAQLCTPQVQPAQMCTPYAQPMQLCTPYAQPAQLCTPQVQPAQMCTPYAQPVQLCTPQGQPVQLCAPYAPPVQLCMPPMTLCAPPMGCTPPAQGNGQIPYMGFPTNAPVQNPTVIQIQKPKLGPVTRSPEDALQFVLSGIFPGGYNKEENLLLQGMNSFQIMQLITRCGEQGYRLKIEDVMKNPTFSGIVSSMTTE